MAVAETETEEKDNLVKSSLTKSGLNVLKS